MVAKGADRLPKSRDAGSGEWDETGIGIAPNGFMNKLIRRFGRIQTSLLAGTSD